MPATIPIRRALPSEIAQLVNVDEDAATLYQQEGVDFSGPALVAFAEAEQRRWLSALERGLGEVALGPDGETVGFIILGFVDGRAYLDQLAVARSWMGQGVGRGLLERAISWSEPWQELWLTTYAHVPWNAPMYARHGFTSVDEAACGPQMRELLREQRAALPFPEQRVAMLRAP